MRLLIIVASNERGGAEEYALTIASAASRSYEPHVAIPLQEGTESLVRDLKATGAHIHALRIPKRHFQRLKSEPWWKQASTPTTSSVLQALHALERGYAGMVEAGSALWQYVLTIFLLVRCRPGVVLVELPYPTYGFGIVLACASVRVPAAVVFQLYPFPVRFRGAKVKALLWARSRAQQWIAVSEDNKKLICGTFHIAPEGIRRIYNGIDLPSGKDLKGDDSAARVRLRRELGLPANARILLTIGRLNKQKGYDDLIPAIPHLLKEFRNVWFVWLGQGDRSGFYEQQLKEYGVAERVLLPGHRPDVPRFARAADLLIMPSRFEGFPFAVLEAMACGLPVVSTGVGGIPEIIQHNLHGILTRTGDSCDMLEAVRWALRHPGRMRAMARQAGKRVREFSKERMVRETLDVIHALGHR